jgi:hypothetical protein
LNISAQLRDPKKIGGLYLTNNLCDDSGVVVDFGDNVITENYMLAVSHTIPETVGPTNVVVDFEMGRAFDHKDGLRFS